MFSDLSTLANVVTTLATMGKKPDGNTQNGDTATPIAKAFDDMAKAAQPQKNLNSSLVSY